MYIILSITIIIALAMACCFLYASKRELEGKNQLLKDAKDQLSRVKDAAVEESLAYRCQLDSLGRIKPRAYFIEGTSFSCTVYALFQSDGWKRKVAVKKFYYADDDEYTLNCAEELLDKLNEKY